LPQCHWIFAENEKIILICKYNELITFIYFAVDKAKTYKVMDSDSDMAGDSVVSSNSSTPAQSQYNAAAYLSTFKIRIFFLFVILPVESVLNMEDVNILVMVVLIKCVLGHLYSNEDGPSISCLVGDKVKSILQALSNRITSSMLLDLNRKHKERCEINLFDLKI